MKFICFAIFFALLVAMILEDREYKEDDNEDINDDDEDGYDDDDYGWW